jgi:hypothetical protein
MLDKIKEFVNRMNQLGIPAPMIRDPKTGKASVSLTTVVISFGMCVIGLCGKAAGFLGGVDLSQALMLFGMSAGLYFSRKVQKNDKGVIIAEKKNSSGQPE